MRVFLATLSFALMLPIAAAQAQQKAAPGDDPTVIPKAIRAPFTGDLPEMKKRRYIRALVASNPTDFFLDGAEPKGIIVEMLELFEKQINKGVKKEVERTRIAYVPVPFKQLIPSLLDGRGDVIAAMMTVTPEREKKVIFAHAGKGGTNEVVVAHKSVEDVKSLDDLAGREVYVLNGSSYEEHLRQLNQDFKKRKLKPIKIIEADEHLSTEDVLEMLNSGLFKLTVVDDYKALLWDDVLKDLRVLADVKVAENTQIAWAVRPENKELHAALAKFKPGVTRGSKLGNILIKRYYKNTEWVKNPASRQARQKLEAVIELFKKYGGEYGFDALAVAAQAYQESKLDHSVKSSAGAVGIMQVLPTTGKDPNVNVGDVAQLENNIHAGVKYLAFLRDRYFSDPAIEPDDQMALAWAAYNAGPGNVRKMRRLAEEMDLNPNEWFDNVEVAAGKVTGTETVRYVANIYKYYVAYQLAEQLRAKKEEGEVKPKDNKK